MGKFKTFQQNLLLLAGSIVFSAIFAEIVLRIILPPPIIWLYPQERYQNDTQTGHWLEPEQQSYTHDKPVSTNSIGIRDKEYKNEIPHNTYRVLALGDSQTFGNGLESVDTWPKQLQLNLNQKSTEKHVEVINCGLPASDTWQHEIILKRMLETYQADAVVLAFYVNDVVKRFTPIPVQRNAGYEWKERIGNILKRSALLLTLRTTWSTIKQSLSPGMGFIQQQALLNGEQSSEIESRWRQVEQSLQSMKKLSDEHNAFFGIAALPRRDHVDGRLLWEAYGDQLGHIAEQLQIPMLSMLPPLQQAYKTNGKDLFISWDGHNSKVANSVIAQEIANEMLANIKSR